MITGSNDARAELMMSTVLGRPWSLYHQNIPIGGTGTTTSGAGNYVVLPQATGKPELAGSAYLSPIIANHSVAASSQLEVVPRSVNKRGLFDGGFTCPTTTTSSSAGDCAVLFTPDFGEVVARVKCDVSGLSLVLLCNRRFSRHRW